MNKEAFITQGLSLLEQGFNVIPLHKWNDTSIDENARGKMPWGKWQEYQTRFATPKEVYEWSKLDDDINIGIVCGITSNLTVIDADTEEAVKALTETYHIPDTLKVKTGKGFHYYYKYCPNPDVNNAVSKNSGVIDGMDIRTQGGQVVAPGSTHRSGRVYEWHNPGTPIADFPKNIEELFIARAAATKRPGAKASTGKDLSAMGEGDGRNAKLTSIAGSLHHMGVLDNDMLRENVKAINAKFAEPLTDREVDTIVDSIIKYDTEAQKHRLTEIGVSERFSDQYHDTVCFNSNSKNWMVYDGKRWCEKTTDGGMCPEVLDKYISLVRNIPNEVEEDSEYRDKYEKFARDCESAKKVQYILRLSAEKLCRNANFFDKDPYIVNLQNKTLNLRTHKVQEQRASDFLSKHMNVNYDESARCPLWNSFLLKIFNGNADLIGYIQRAIGYSLTGDTTEQVFFTLYGSGANGKSVFLDTLLHIFGDYGQQATFTTFLAKQNDNGIRNDIACMTGARFVSAAESGVFKTIDDALIKDITGGKKVRARFLHKEHFEFTPQMKIWLATNHKPNIHDDSNGMWRRVRLIPFTVTIPSEEQDKKLYYKLLDEAPGILNWCLDGFKQWQEHGLGRCHLVEEATEEYQEAMDVMGRFTYDCLKLGENLQVKSSALYDCFTGWCKKNGEPSWKHTTFSIKFADKGYKKVRKNDGQYWTGVDLNIEF